MQNEQEILENLQVTLEKYRANKTKVSPEDLAGKYAAAFGKLKAKLKAETESYLKAVIFSGFTVLKDDHEELFRAIEQSLKDNQIGKRAGTAVFKNFSIEELKQIAAEQRERIIPLYEEYFNRHYYLYITAPCLDPDNPQPPLICNYLTDKCYDMSKQEWVERDKLAQQREAV